MRVLLSFVAVVTDTAPSTGAAAADKFTNMVDGIEKQIYLPAQLAGASYASRKKARTSSS